MSRGHYERKFLTTNKRASSKSRPLISVHWCSLAVKISRATDPHYPVYPVTRGFFKNIQTFRVISRRISCCTSVKTKIREGQNKKGKQFMKNRNINFFVVQLAFAYFAFAPQVQATCQEGCLTNNNTVLGDDALLNGTGVANTALGYQALFSNTNGIGNTAIGVQTLYNNTGGFASGYGNTATGWTALFHNTLGSSNTANGVQTLYNN